MSVNFRLKATKIMGQMKAFYGQRIPEPTCARKETVDMDIPVTSRDGDRKTMQSIIKKQVDLPQEKESGTSWANYEEHLQK